MQDDNFPSRLALPPAHARTASRRALFWTLSATLGVAIAQPACFGKDYWGGATPLTGDDASTGAQPPAGCDTTVDPKDSPACIDDSYAVFVDPNNGNDAAAGTKASPVKTIARALTLLNGKPRIYICGTSPLNEHVELTNAVSLYGGFNCGTWDYNSSPNNKAIIKPNDVGYALRVTSVSPSSPIVLSDLAFVAQAGASPGDSSIAAFASNSTDITFKRCSLTAQGGVFGSPGNNGTDGAWSDPAAGGAGMTCSCTTGGSTTGGKGGNVGVSGTDGLPSIPANPAGSDGMGGTGNIACTSGSSGHNGSNAQPGANGASSNFLGQLTANGWTPGDGLDGIDGQPGQGGGGGGGGNDSAGGAGGCGGCGGTRGTAGHGGGASVALLSFQGTVQLIGCTLTTNQAGDGGSGGNGGAASKGANGAQGAPAPNSGCNGGAGGYGGAGGAGSGGAGGISAGVLYSGTAPTLTDTTFTASVADPEGQYGAAGKSGAPSIAAGNPGLSGLSGTMVSADDWTVTP